MRKGKMDQEALRYHSEGRPGKIAVVPTKPYHTQHDLSLAYSPGVAAPCREIEANPEEVYRYTNKGNLVAVISNGTAVLGLGNIGALAGKPVMEGKSMLFKTYADIDAFDIEVDETDPEAFIRTVKAIAPTFGGITIWTARVPSPHENDSIDETCLLRSYRAACCSLPWRRAWVPLCAACRPPMSPWAQGATLSTERR